MKAPVAALALLAGYDKYMDASQIQEFIAGLVFGLVQKDDLKLIETCLKDGDTLTKEVTIALQDFAKKDLQDILAGVSEIGVVLQQLPQDLGDCTGMQPDIQRIENWAQIFKDPKLLIQTVTSNIIKNYKEITTDIASTYSDIQAQNFYNAGVDIADLMIANLGPVPKADEQPEYLQQTQW